MTIGRNGMLVTLAWAAGCVDAISYIGFGHVFTANMTGNTVLLGLSLGRVPGLAVSRSLAALFGFALGVTFGALIVRRSRPGEEWPPEVARAISAEALVLLAFAGTWWRNGGGQPNEAAVYLLILLSAIAMGLQSAAIRRVGVTGVATTYITGTLTGCVAGIVEGFRESWTDAATPSNAAPGTGSIGGAMRWPSGTRLQATVLVVYGLGAFASGLAESHWSVAAPFLPLAAIAFAAFSGRQRTQSDRF